MYEWEKLDLLSYYFFKDIHSTVTFYTHNKILYQSYVKCWLFLPSPKMGLQYMVALGIITKKRKVWVPRLEISLMRQLKQMDLEVNTSWHKQQSMAVYSMDSENQTSHSLYDLRQVT